MKCGSARTIVSLPLLTLLALVGAFTPGCSCTSPAGGGGDDDGGAMPLDGGDCPVACLAGEVCRFGICLVQPAPCQMDDDCFGDFYCDEATLECLPWGIGPGGQTDPTCTRETYPGVFIPGVQCEWLGPPAGDPFPDHRNVLGTPMVVDFGGVGDPELSRPSIVFVSYNYTDGGGLSCIGTDPLYFGVIRVIDGRTCEQQASIAAPTVVASSTVALGDLNADGSPEIVAARTGGGLVAFTADGMGGFELLWQTASTFAAGECDWAGPAIHDLDDDGLPEVVFYGAVFDALGNSITEELGPLSSGGSTGYIPVVADVDADGVAELVTGSAIHGWDAAANVWVAEGGALGPAAQTAVADLGTFGADPALDDRTVLDGIAEVVTVSASTMRAFTIGGRALYSGGLPGGGSGGAPTIADFDGDGRAEMASAGGSAYTVFDLDCNGGGTPATCASARADGILWTQASQDLSSNVTGSSVFDFEGDGRAEAVYGDECFTRVYDGTTGVVNYSRYRTSCTWYENPVIADVDGDYNAEIIITSNTNCNVSCPAVDPIFDGLNCFDASDCPGTTTCTREQPTDQNGKCRCTLDIDCGGDGFVCLDPIAGPSAAGKVCRAQHPGPGTAFGIRVVADSLDRWVNTRRIWNQHAYSVTNVSEGGAIPRTSQWARNWDTPGLNNFRQNAPGDGVGAALSPDLTVQIATLTCTGSGTADVTVTVCNRGTEPVADGLPVTVYAGRPPTDPVACTAITTADILPGNCVQATCSWSGVPSTPLDATVVADDNGTGAGANTECKEENNSFVMLGVKCS